MYNRHTIAGNVGSVDENRFSVAVNKNYQKGGKWETKTSWFTIFFGGKQAEYIENMGLSKGDMVLVDAEVSSSMKDGKTVYYWNLQSVKRLSKAGNRPAEENRKKAKKEEVEVTPWDDDEDWE